MGGSRRKLQVDMASPGLKTGDVGTVVQVYADDAVESPPGAALKRW